MWPSSLSLYSGFYIAVLAQGVYFLKVNAAYQYRYLSCCPCEEVYFLMVKPHTYKDDYVAELCEEVYFLKVCNHILIKIFTYQYTDHVLNNLYKIIRVRVIVFNTTFNNISVISWQSVLGGGNRRKPLTCRKSLANFT